MCLPLFSLMIFQMNAVSALPSFRMSIWASMISKLMLKYALCSTALSRRFESLFVLFLWTDCRVKWLGFLKQKIYTPFSLYYPSTPPVIGAGWRAQRPGLSFLLRGIY